MNNYTLIEEKFIDEINSNVSVYSHNKTKARIVTLKNDDPNKVFLIGFRTPPINSTGLTHILEHSVLCGSKKYPVKDPFVELLKSSLNTFLNAFTFPDKTCYPCASINDKDFKNLMDIYLDAVFYPRIYTNKEIFMQEGWHYELNNENEDIFYNGVVYNEMKGAFSDPEQVLYRNIMHSLYPDTPYGLESGGDPKYIPDLSYEEFLNFHSKFYHPSNSYIYLYGDMDFEERLDYLDKEYLSKFDKIEFDTRVPFQNKFDGPKYETYKYQSEALENKTFLSYNVAFPTTLDYKLIIATKLLLNNILLTPGSRLKQALIDAKIGDDVDAIFDDGLLMPMLTIMASNSNKENEEKFISVIDNELKKILEEGLDKNALLANINFFEFKSREDLFSPRMPKGLNLILRSLDSYLYDDNLPYLKLIELKYYNELREDLKGDYFENIIKDYVLNNNHKTYVSLVPDLEYSKNEEIIVSNKLADYKKSLSDKEIKDLVEMNIKLKEYQGTPSSKEELDTLPKLSLEDIKMTPEKYNLEVIDSKYKLLFGEYHTNDIAYVKYYFNIDKLNDESLRYTSLFTDLLFNMSTKNHSYLEINQLIQGYSGGLYSNINYSTKLDNSCYIQLIFGYSALTKNVKLMQELLEDTINNTIFNDYKRLKERLLEIKNTLTMSISNNGHRFAARRALSYINEENYVGEVTTGISYLDFITDLCNNFDNKKDEIVTKLNEVNNLLGKDNFIGALTGNKEMLENIKPLIDGFYNELNDKSKYDKQEFKENILNEAFKAPFDISFNASAGKYSLPYNSGMMVLLNSIYNDFLWTEVRVKGGAYGVMPQVRRDGYMVFVSYRDPNIKKTYDTYLKTPEYIDGFNPDEDELLKIKIGAIGNSILVLHNKDKADMARVFYFKGITDDDRIEEINNVINAKASDFKKYREAYAEALNNNVITTIGNKNKVEENKELFKNVRNLV
ncbi:MAG: insulinase family protein [Acholeplasmatales bacterium]|nr:insulinase family protein [Acholeplasmatales bacterium]